ncbi:MAG TPA: AI-2E family transporter [Pseudonocardia sp.]|nr:AI-2E family transporter [Pseudonocardia sp.]
MPPPVHRAELSPAPAASESPIPGPLRVASELSARVLLILAAASVVVYLLVELRVVAIPIAIALLLSALLAPLVSAAVTRLKLPRGVATGLVLAAGIALFATVMSFVVNAFIAGLPDLSARLVQSYQLSIRPLLAGPPLRIPMTRLDDVSGELQRSISANIDVITTGALSTAATVGELASGTLLLLFVLIFFLQDGSQIWRFLIRVVPLAQRDRTDIAGQRAFASLVGYTRATVVVAVVDAVGIGIGLWAIGVPLVVPLAALVLLGAFIPVVGAVLSGSVAVLIALVANGPVPALIVLGVVIAVMQLESHVLQPVLLGRAVQLHPLAVVLGVAAGVVVAGITGALLAVPIIAMLSAIVRSLLSPDEPRPHDINPLDPLHAKSGPVDPTERRRLIRIPTGVTLRRQPDGGQPSGD